jgi:hypothetical protein
MGCLPSFTRRLLENRRETVNSFSLAKPGGKPQQVDSTTLMKENAPTENGWKINDHQVADPEFLQYIVEKKENNGLFD